MNDWIRYTKPQDFPISEYPVLTDHFLGLNLEFKRHPPKKTVKKILGVYPTRKKLREKLCPEKKNVSFLYFPVFSTSKTSYATIKELSSVFSEYFINLSIIPIISPYPDYLFAEPKLLAKNTFDNFYENGAILYDIEA
jgi:hypothetical protein